MNNLKPKQDNQFISKVQYINCWKQFLNEAMNYHAFVTFEYDIPQSDFFAENGMSFLLKSVQRKLYSNSYIKRNDCFQGFSFAERHKQGNKKGFYHFHNLINFGSIKVTEEFKSKFVKVFEEKMKKLTYNRENNQTRIADSPVALDITFDIDNQKKLVEYCSKDLFLKNFNGSKVSFIDWRGADSYERMVDINLAKLNGQYYVDYSNNNNSHGCTA